MHSISDQLESGLKALQVPATSQQQHLLLDYLQLLKKWNKTYNLVSDASDSVLLYRHLLDSIAIAPYVNAHLVLDVGSGGGFPGVPLAILKPATRFILVDSNGKKARFLFQVKAALSLANLDVENCRIEHYQSDSQIDIVTCRAFSSLPDILQKIAPLLSEKSHLLAMKGQLPEAEIKEIGPEFEVAGVYRLNVPVQASEQPDGCPDESKEVERHLIDIIPHPGFIR